MGDWVINVVRSLGLLGVGLLAFLENVFPPIPSELIMPLAGYLSAYGDMSLTGAIVAGSVGTLLGTIGWYYVGRRIGEERLRAWIDKHGCWLTLSNDDIDKAQDKLERHGAAVVFIGRLIPGIRTWVSVPAGLARMPFPKFVLYSSAGTVIWTAFLTSLGRIVGEKFPKIEEYVGTVSMIVLLGIAVWYVYRLVRQLKGRATRSAEG
jgi:membrane protein DedA with SNARE-associated domain